MKGYVKALIGAGAAAIGGIVTLALVGREEKLDVVDTDFEEVETDQVDTTEDDTEVKDE